MLNRSYCNNYLVVLLSSHYGTGETCGDALQFAWLRMQICLKNRDFITTFFNSRAD
jgi:hypothetical protein